MQSMGLALSQCFPLRIMVVILKPEIGTLEFFAWVIWTHVSHRCLLGCVPSCHLSEGEVQPSGAGGHQLQGKRLTGSDGQRSFRDAFSGHLWREGSEQEVKRKSKSSCS